MATSKKSATGDRDRERSMKRPSAPTERRYGLGMILLVMFLSSGVFAALGVLAAHFGH